MSTIAPSPPAPAPSRRRARERLNLFDRRANRALKWFCYGAGLVIFVVMVGIAYEVINGASAAISKFGLGFVVHTEWIPNRGVFGAWAFIYGTLMTSVFTLIAATVIGVSIGLYLSMLAPRAVAAVVGPLVEMLAAVPSVILGFIGLIVIAPFSQSTLEPILHTLLGWIPVIGNVFGEPQTTGLSIFTASLVLTIMVVPIISALSRDLFLTVPRELKEGAEALGSTTWEVIRGVVLPTTSSGIVAACVLGFGRAIGEAIAVSFVVGGLTQVVANIFEPGNTAAAVIATQFGSPDTALHTSALYYLAVILLVMSLITNLVSSQIAKRFSASVA
jgi:phosphate transport system permease protein